MNNPLIWILVAVVAFFVYKKYFSKTSSYTIPSFDSVTDAVAALKLFKENQDMINTELKSKLNEAKSAGKTKDEMVTITDQYADFSNALTKAFSKWAIMHG